VLLEAFHPSVSRTHQRLVNAPLLGFRPLQRSTALGARMPRELQPPATIRPQGFPPSRRLASPKTMRASSRLTSDEPCGPPTRARPLRSWGSTGPPPLAQTFRLEGRATAPGFPLQGSLLPCDEPVLAGSPLSRFALPEATPCSRGITWVHRAPQSLDRRRVGVSQRSYLRAPAFLRFSIDLHARS